MWKRIYKHYNLMIDICFWFLVYANGKGLLQHFGVLPSPFYPDNWWGDSLYAVHLVLFDVSFFGLYVLLLVPKFRDEYARKLWRHAASAFSYFILLLPFLWVAAWAIASRMGRGVVWLQQNPIGRIGHDFGNLGNRLIDVGFHQLEGIDLLIHEMYEFFPVVFAGIYKWHRWRDGVGR